MKSGQGTNFEEAYAEFIDKHMKKRRGERRGRLERGHQEAERLFCKNVWWPLRGNFDDLHPEYEILDWRGHSYFCDFVWWTDYVKLVFEIKGFGPHVRDMDRQRYCNELNRETFLTAMGYQVIAIAYDDVAYRPDLVITLLRMVFSRYQTEASPVSLLSVMEREVIRLACQLARPVRPLDVRKHIGINPRTAVRILQSLCDKGLFVSIMGNGEKRTVRYEPQKQMVSSLL